MVEKYILGIETSCDDTSAAVVGADGTVLSSIIATQTDIHAEYGGVFPEMASRAHSEFLLPVIKKAMKDAQVTHEDLCAIGVTRGPGLIGSILVGLNTAAGLGAGWKIPVIGVNHLRGHLRSADLEEKRIIFPSLILLISGGHTFLALMKNHDSIELLGTTRDDSAGEAYDKVGRMLGLDYPAGPAIDRLALQGESNIPFPRPMLHKGLEFSFSGIKSAVSRYVETNKDFSKEDVAASFVDACIDVLMKKCKVGLVQTQAKSLTIVGGVSASKQIRERADRLCKELNVHLSLPPVKWSTDNAAMIALATWDYINADIHPEPIPVMGLSITEY